MKRVLNLLIFLALAACVPAPLTLVPVDTLVAQTMAAMPKTNTPIPTNTPLPTATIYLTEIPTLDPNLSALGASCIPLNTEHLRGLVTRVIDGETIEVAVANTSYLVRYIGLDAPGIVPTIEWQGPLAIAANERLVSGKTVTLVKDVSETDPNGFYLRYVLVEGVFVNYELVRQGYARNLSMPPDTACDANFLLAQSEALLARAGVWVATPTLSPTVTKTPTATRTPTSTGQPACSCYGPPLTCKDFPTQAQAQACFEYCKSLGLDDIFGLDKNHNGKACEGT